jgi:hypothetical protein
MTGRTPGLSYHHSLFAGLALAKVAVLLMCSAVWFLTLAEK